LKLCKSGLHQYPDDDRQCYQCKNQRRQEWDKKTDRKEYFKQYYKANKPTFEERRLIKLAMTEKALEARKEYNKKNYLKRREAALSRKNEETV